MLVVTDEINRGDSRSIAPLIGITFHIRNEPSEITNKDMFVGRNMPKEVCTKIMSGADHELFNIK